MPLDAARPWPGSRIVHVVRQFAPSVGGLEEAVLKLALNQREREGLSPSVVTLDRVFADRRRLARRETVRGIPVRRLPWSGSARYPLAPGVLGAIGEADLVHVHGIDFFFDFLAATRRLHGRRMVASTHGGFFHTAYASRLKQRWFHLITRRSVRAYDAVIACSPSDAAMFAPLDPPGFTTIENGIDLQRFRAPDGVQPDAKRILTFGRFAHHKRIPALFGLLRGLLARDAGWRLTVAGSPWDQDAAYLQAQAAAEGVANSVTIIDSPDDATLARLMAEARFFACASAHEGFGIAAVEAAAAGLIPVLSGIPPFLRLTQRLGDGFAGALDAPEPAVEFCLQAVADHDRLAARRAALVARAAAYDWAHAASAHAAVYARILGTVAA